MRRGRKPIITSPTGRAAGPLRKIVREFVDERGLEREELECGHVLSRKSDIIGPTNAYRRRCRHCRDKGGEQ